MSDRSSARVRSGTFCCAEEVPDARSFIPVGTNSFARNGIHVERQIEPYLALMARNLGVELASVEANRTRQLDLRKAI